MNELTAPPGAIVHEVTFQRNTRTGDHRAKCTCGWVWFAPTLLECQLRGSTHDIEWENVKND